MSRAATLPSRAADTSSATALLQRKCACGASAGLSGTCEDCGRKKILGLQTKALAIGSPHDALEYEADRIADQVMAGRSGAPRATALPSAQAAVQRADGKATGSFICSRNGTNRPVSPSRPSTCPSLACRRASTSSTPTSPS